MFILRKTKYAFVDIELVVARAQISERKGTKIEYKKG